MFGFHLERKKEVRFYLTGKGRYVEATIHTEVSPPLHHSLLFSLRYLLSSPHLSLNNSVFQQCCPSDFQTNHRNTATELDLTVLHRFDFSVLCVSGSWCSNPDPYHSQLYQVCSLRSNPLFRKASSVQIKRAAINKWDCDL